MDFNKITAGSNIPDSINVIIEIPARGEPVKYEVDKDSGVLMVDRFLGTPMHYPTNYGYVPKTLAEDGDPVDVLVITPIPLISGAVIPCRPVGMLEMTDESGEDAKILAVPDDKLTTLYQHIQAPSDAPQELLAEISHFFEHYKDLEEGKWVEVRGWTDAAQAKKEIIASVKRYQQA